MSRCAWQPDESLAALKAFLLCAGGEVCRGCTHASCADVQGSCGWALCCGSQFCSGCEQLGRGEPVRCAPEAARCKRHQLHASLSLWAHGLMLHALLEQADRA